jgi:hypothetical protein
MSPYEVLRVVAIRRGRLKPAEFRLRPGERGLSLFALVDDPSPAEVIRAVQAAGKQGNLAAAVFASAELRQLGLRLVFTNGGTPSPEVNAIHLETRLPYWRELIVRLRGGYVADYFNDHLSERLAQLARLLE